ncbi:hypothetical protein [Dyadobacter sp. 676]|uniref:Uncharacterized protein n=1 Tax=Dyadobacter sp. 676 TaxID=3088362 RepID=A0AAU8FRT3_9BACT
MSPAYLFSILILAAAVLSCSKGNEKSPELIEANRLHLEAMKISVQLEQKLENLSSQAKSAAQKTRIDSLKNLIEVWEENLIEVPGFAHAHDHTHGAHTHKAAPSMTDESMLDYQRQSKEAIIELRDVITKLDRDQK